ncbi:NADH-quinone oxidoreductase subunit H [Pseudokineococcus marinus]|uniref:NADH-quinone oxidoreductase subunit H n=1 Tax=Pseudokineococcus marinus TaxID=351215 RepID=A0A849BPT7_9ACTN|nr:NADH-quinone oxidoreductase subunit H [Pseudokineococcus marinus]NNH22842.1 NADH-quinone oxidoreductase subunit H [Pseudokineococcus marinus]
MGDVVQVAVPWVLLAAVLLGVAALGVTALDGALAARAAGRSASVGAQHPLVETARLLRQRRRTTVAADTLLRHVAVGGFVVAPLLMVAVVPLGEWVLADASVGVVWFNAVDVLVWVLVWLAGWGPNAAWSLTGGYRFLAQAMAYELPLMFALTAPAVAAGSLRVGDVAAAQPGLPHVVWMPVAFVVYCTGVLAFSVRGPLSPAGGAAISGGVLAELSGVDRLLVLAGRAGLLVAGAAFAVPLFLGGGSGPLLPGWLWVLVKTALLAAALVVVRRRLPDVRPERFLALGWTVLLPAALLQLLVVSVVVVVRS